ncbi:hypothetical protein QCA50_015694 [Cerrena zonata]|uniref:Uncharacterized protein n=1 Tax=Cerrena zonata TaxID=2478898 RepID=A0AAW0FMB2_9APHY
MGYGGYYGQYRLSQFPPGEPVLIGDVFVIIGFSILTAASWKEISEGNEDDDVETASTLSFAISTDGN